VKLDEKIGRSLTKLPIFVEIPCGQMGSSSMCGQMDHSMAEALGAWGCSEVRL
jgi:hypothetical protein